MRTLRDYEREREVQAIFCCIVVALALVGLASVACIRLGMGYGCDLRCRRGVDAPVTMSDFDREPRGLQCEFAGHSWRDAGGGLEICALCEAERWADETEQFGGPCPDGVDDFMGDDL